MRCLTLASGLKEHGYSVSFVSKPCDEHLITKIEQARYPVHRLPLECDLTEDCAATIEFAQQLDLNPIIILDSYAVDQAYQKAIKDADLRLIVIDDPTAYHMYADLVINQNIYADRKLYSAEPDTRFLLGPRYALLRGEFTCVHDRKKAIPKRARNILVTLGGSDPENQTLKIMQALASFDMPLTVRIILGVSYSQEEDLQMLATQWGERFSIHRDDSKMSEHMIWADLAISGGGSTCWELACAGVHNLILVLAENQRRNAIGLSHAGISVNLGWWKDLSIAAIADAIARLISNQGQREAMSRAGKVLVDGRGAERVVAEIERMPLAWLRGSRRS
jgi:UDP-2,4-diacetamido-2,4,6-trideoxy-beta-L-altropyranose hydrolase